MMDDMPYIDHEVVVTGSDGDRTITLGSGTSSHVLFVSKSDYASFYDEELTRPCVAYAPVKDRNVVQNSTGVCFGGQICMAYLPRRALDQINYPVSLQMLVWCVEILLRRIDVVVAHGGETKRASGVRLPLYDWMWVDRVDKSMGWWSVAAMRKGPVLIANPPLVGEKEDAVLIRGRTTPCSRCHLTLRAVRGLLVHARSFAKPSIALVTARDRERSRA